MSLGQVLDTMRRRWWLPVAAALIALTSSLILLNRGTETYRAEVTLLVAPSEQVTTGLEAATSLQVLDPRSGLVTTLADILARDRFLHEAGQTLGLDASALEGYTTEASVMPESNVVVAAVRGPDAETTALLANDHVARAGRYFGTLYRPFAVDILEPAVPPTSSDGTNTAATLAVAIVVGLALGVFAAVALEPKSSPDAWLDLDSDDFSPPQHGERLVERVTGDGR